jgi:hypothetical protein
MEFLIIGVVSALNLIVIVHKFKKGRLEDGIFDSILFVLLATLFSGSYAGMVVAMVASLIISIYLWASPPAFFKNVVNSKEVTSIVKDVKTLLPTPPKKSTSDKLKDLHFD